MAATVGSLVALGVAVLLFHTGGDVQVASCLLRLSGPTLALVIASLPLEMDRAIDALSASTPRPASGKAAYIRNFDDQIERDTERVRKLRILVQIAASLFCLSVFALIWYFGGPLATTLFSTPGTRFMISACDRGPVAFLYGFMWFVCLGLIRPLSLIALAKAYPIAVARMASWEVSYDLDTSESWSWDPPTEVSRQAFLRQMSALMGLLIPMAAFSVGSYLRISERGIGVASFPTGMEVYHLYKDVSSISKKHLRIESGSGHQYVVQFSDGTEWRSGAIPDGGSTEPDCSEALTFAAAKANLPIRHYRDRRQ